MRPIPTYDLYGEKTGAAPQFWVHSESIPSRSSLHDWEIKPHRHEQLFQILHIRHGGGEALLGDQRQAIASPCVITVPARHNHGFRFSPDIDGAVMTLVSGRFAACRPGQPGLGDWLAGPRQLRIGPDHPDAGYLVDTLDRIEREILLGTAGPVALVDSLLTSALMIMSRMGGLSDTVGADRDRARFAELERLIKDDFRRHLPIDFYARRLGLSATHLNRITHAVAGKPVSRLVDERIITEAKRDLAFTSISIRQIAESLGFDDQAYFSRFFTRHTGMSPRAWRDSERAT